MAHPKFLWNALESFKKLTLNSTMKLIFNKLQDVLLAVLVDALMNQVVSHVDSVSAGDEAKIQSAGLDTRAAATATTHPPPPPSALDVTAGDSADDAINIPPHTYLGLFLRFLRFGFLAHVVGFRRGKTPAKSARSMIFRALDIDAFESILRCGMNPHTDDLQS